MSEGKPMGPDDIPSAVKIPTKLEEISLPKKPAVRSKEIWGVIATIIGAVLAYFGIEANPEFLEDGFQLAEDLVALIGLVMAIVGAVLKTYGKRAATSVLSGIMTSK